MLVTDKLLRDQFGLTPREIDVAHRLAEGVSNREIAEELDISPHTVKNHVEKILAKVGVRSRSRLAAVLIRSQRKYEQ